MNDINKRLLEKIEVLVRLSALNIIKDKKYAEQVELLSSVGLQPKEIADAAVFLGSNESLQMTGQVMHINGGQMFR